jgi:hypothetical protein
LVEMIYAFVEVAKNTNIATEKNLKKYYLA